MRFNRRLTVAIALVVLAASSVVFVAFRGPDGTLPEGVIPVSLDESTAYLIPARAGYLLFDTGYPWDFTTFRSALSENEIALSEIHFVFISHAHDDHVGFLPKLVRSNPDIRVIVHERTAARLTTGKNNTQNGGGLFNRWVYAAFRVKQRLKPRWTLTFPPYEVRPADVILRDDEVDLEDLLGAPISTLFTPGHTSDSVSLIYDDTHIFCGDLASTSFNWIGGRYLTVFNENVDDVYASWSVILDRDIPVTIPSHGRPFRTQALERHIGALHQEDLVPIF